MNKYNYTTFDDLNESEREIAQQNPKRILELRLNAVEVLLQKATDDSAKERQFYRQMDTINTLDAIDLVGRRQGTYPELYRQFEAHLRFTRIPKMAAVEFVNSLASELIEIEALLRVDNTNPKEVAEKIAHIRNRIPSYI